MSRPSLTSKSFATALLRLRKSSVAFFGAAQTSAWRLKMQNRNGKTSWNTRRS
ncbi:unnamed protein product [Symbiodinium natans]|uniref:Uncharacterized protein n=1 Tax=Symbiodinium natans TaxID=878477 RepID=A0A812U369_9DINO|nr:unnamed protein product [Symbiodinium natans]